MAPPSRCPHCGMRLGPVDLVPLFSYVALRGRCRHCRNPISPRYPVVEALTAGIAYGLYATHFGTRDFWPYASLASVLIVVSFIDLEHMYIPDAVLLAGVLLWGAASAPNGSAVLHKGAAGAVLGFGTMFAIYLLARGGMGLGDVKLAALIGLYLGPAMTLLAVVLGFIAGSIAGLSLVLARRKALKDRIPFAPFLALGAVAAMLWGRQLLGWYFLTVIF